MARCLFIGALIDAIAFNFIFAVLSNHPVTQTVKVVQFFLKRRHNH